MEGCQSIPEFIGQIKPLEDITMGISLVCHGVVYTPAIYFPRLNSQPICFNCEKNNTTLIRYIEKVIPDWPLVLNDNTVIASKIRLIQPKYKCTTTGCRNQFFLEIKSINEGKIKATKRLVSYMSERLGVTQNLVQLSASVGLSPSVVFNLTKDIKTKRKNRLLEKTLKW